MWNLPLQRLAYDLCMTCALGNQGGVVAGFFIKRTQYSPGFETKPLRYAFPYVCYVETGHYSETTPAGSFQRLPGTVHFHAANEMQSGVIGDSGAQCVSIVALEERLISFGAHVDWCRSATQPHVAGLALILARLSRHLSSDKVEPQHVEASCVEIYARLAEALRCSTEPKWVAGVCEYIKFHCNRRIGLTELADIAGVHPVHVSRGLKRWRGYTPRELQKQAQLALATEMLLTTGQSAGCIAAESGFADQSHFGRSFKRHTGRRVSEFRNATRTAQRC